MALDPHCPGPPGLICGGRWMALFLTYKAIELKRVVCVCVCVRTLLLAPVTNLLM